MQDKKVIWHKRLFGVLAILILIIVVIFFGYAYWLMEVPPVSMQKMEEIKEGMSKDAVQATLGRPAKIIILDTTERWVYSHGWQIFEVGFSHEGRVEYKIFDK